MKKLMIVAAAAAMTTVAGAASFKPVDCADTITPTTTDCDYMVFKVTASGKTTQDVNSGAYKKVASLKVKKGALVFKFNADCAAAVEDPICCYDTADLFATVKVGKETTKIAVPDISVDKWSVFGKDLEKAINWSTQIKQGKKVTLESDLFLVTPSGIAVKPADPADDYISIDKDNDAYLKTISFAASAFGKYQVKVNKASSKVSGKGYCVVTTNSTACAATWTPKSYSGWFVGTRELLDGDQACFNCECGTYEVFGGTWKATYDAKKSTSAAAQQYAFGNAIFSSADASEWADEVEAEDDEDEE